MRRIYVLVEGQTEFEFVRTILAGYLREKGIYFVQPTALKKGGDGGGFSNLDDLKKDLKNYFFQQDSPIITTMVDLFRFPLKSGDHQEAAELRRLSAEPNIENRINGLEKVMLRAAQKIKPEALFIPYIQQHEFEALLFASPSAFKFEDEHSKISKAVEAVLNEYLNPEDINTTEDGHPAKRLASIFAACGETYSKGSDAIRFIQTAGIAVILEKCPRFRSWVERLIETAAT